jgi:CRP-like cAMP-binding protein
LLKPVNLAARQELERPNRAIEYVYFIVSGIAAVLSVSGETHIALGLVGCEGATGIAVFLGDNRSPHLTLMLTEGKAFRLSITELQDAMNDEPELNRLLLRYSLAFYNQAAHTALSNATSTVEQRVARWLLMTNDRFAGDTLPITHDRIAYMLHVRRVAVTDALRSLSKAGLIKGSRGSVQIFDRRGLEDAAGSYYGRPESEFTRLVGTPWPPVPN